MVLPKIDQNESINNLFFFTELKLILNLLGFVFYLNLTK